MNYFDEYKETTNECWADGLHMLPPHMIGAVVRYVLHGIPPGGFLSAVICGNLYDAIRRADDVNKNALPEYGMFFTNYTPIGCFGGQKIMSDWIDAGGLMGKTKGRIMPKPIVVTTAVYPPIPTRNHDWAARFEFHDEDTDLIGEGETENDAVLDLFTNAVEYDGDGSEQEEIVNLAFGAWLDTEGKVKNNAKAPSN